MGPLTPFFLNFRAQTFAVARIFRSLQNVERRSRHKTTEQQQVLKNQRIRQFFRHQCFFGLLRRLTRPCTRSANILKFVHVNTEDRKQQQKGVRGPSKNCFKDEAARVTNAVLCWLSSPLFDYMCKCLFVCIQVHMCTYEYMYTRTHKSAHAHMHVHICMYSQVYICIYDLHIHILIPLSAHGYGCVYDIHGYAVVEAMFKA